MSDHVPPFQLAQEDVSDEHLWLARDNGEAGAQDKLFACHQKFAEKLAWQEYSRRTRGDLEIGDLRQFAFSGLLQAIRNFDPGQGVPFRAFAARRVRGSILNGISKGSEVREQLSWRARIRRERMRSLVGTSDDYDRNSDASSGDLERFTSVVVGLALSFILDQQKSGETDRLNSGYESASWNELTSRMLVELDSLPANEALVLRKHYFEHMDFVEICAIINVSKGRVSQLHRQALLSLQKRLGRRGHFRLER